MNSDQLVVLATFAAVWATLRAGHGIADHVLGQTDAQAEGKGCDAPGRVGISRSRSIRYCLTHVAAYHVVLGVLLAIAWLVLPLPLSPLGVAVGLSWSAITHAVLDRRWPVRWLLVRTGSAGFAKLAGGGINGMYLADQALHGVALWSAALMIAVL